MGKTKSIVRNVVLLVVVAVVLGGSVLLYGYHASPNFRYAADLQQLTQSFKDPESVRYREVYMSKSGALCGEVNAKNSMGGYAGFEEFYTSGGKIVLLSARQIAEGSEDRASAWLLHLQRVDMARACDKSPPEFVPPPDSK